MNDKRHEKHSPESVPENMKRMWQTVGGRGVPTRPQVEMSTPIPKRKCQLRFPSGNANSDHKWKCQLRLQVEMSTPTPSGNANSDPSGNVNSDSQAEMPTPIPKRKCQLRLESEMSTAIHIWRSGFRVGSGRPDLLNMLHFVWE